LTVSVVFLLVAPLASYAADTVLPARLMQSKTLTFCSSMDGPPLDYHDEHQQPIGFSIDVANDVAKSLGNLNVQWRVIPFSGLVAGLLAQQCDMVIGQLFDKPERRKVINLVDYMWASESIVVPKGNKQNIHSLEDLSGKKVAVLNGSTIRSLLEEENEKLKAAGKAPMNVVVYNTDTDAFQALRLQQTDAFGSTVETSAYYQKLLPGQFENALSGFYKILTGIGIRRDDTELTAAVQKAIQDLLKSNRYDDMLKKWGVTPDRLLAG
jgi:polar amino acid transport system substrate-binding protein